MTAPDPRPGYAVLAYAALLALAALAGRLTGQTTRGPQSPARGSETAVEAGVRVSAEVVAATDPLAPEPEAPVRWTVEYPLPGRRDFLLVWPEGL